MEKNIALVREALNGKKLVWRATDGVLSNVMFQNEDNSMSVVSYSKGEIIEDHTALIEDKEIMETGYTKWETLMQGAVMMIHTLNAGETFGGTVTIED